MEARPRGASGPSEDTGAPEAQWGGLERPQEGREGTAPGEQRSAVAEGPRPGPRHLAASWPPPWPDAVTAPSVGAALWEERLRQRPNPPNMKRLETARTGTNTRCPRGGGGGARVCRGGGRPRAQGDASATTAAVRTASSRRAQAAIRREPRSVLLRDGAWDVTGRPSPRWRLVLETGRCHLLERRRRRETGRVEEGVTSGGDGKFPARAGNEPGSRWQEADGHGRDGARPRQGR